MKREIGIFHSMALGNNYSIGGVQKVCVSLLKGFSNQGWKSRMIQHKNNEGIRKFLKKNNLNEESYIFEIPTLKNDYGGISYMNFFISSFKLFISLIKIRIQSKHLDTIILNDITSLFFNKSFRAKHKYLFLHTERFSRFSLARFAVRLWPSKDLTIICPTKNLLDVVNELFPYNRSIYLPTPVFENIPVIKKGFEKRNISSSLDFKLCYIGRISPSKNLKSMIMFGKDLSKFKKVSLDIYGNSFTSDQDKYFRELKDLKSLNDSKFNLKFCGITHNSIETFSNYDFSIILSNGEAIPLAGLESLKAQTPIIAWDALGVNELVIDGFTGVIVSKSDKSKNILVTDNLIKKLESYKMDINGVNNLLENYTISNFIENINYLNSQNK